MASDVSNIVVLGSTGSIGRSTLEVIDASGGSMQVLALTGHTNVELLKQQAIKFRPRRIVATDAAAARADWSDLPPGVTLLTGADAVPCVAGDPEADIVLSAIVGVAGLRGTLAALEAGTTVALANKESLVVGGPLVTQLAKSRGATLLPVDSEHSAIFQALQTGQPEEVRRVVLTASGGPFRKHTPEQLAAVTVAEALAHPTWNMGPKITIDSATLMNKALEIIEARWLFDLEPEQIGVMIHPQSIVHSLVEFVDGSVIAQMGPPDMKLPIHYALNWPRRRPSIAGKLDWNCAMQLTLEPPDFQRFQVLELGLEVARAGGTAGAVLNGANEAIVAAFLAGELSFNEIVPACRSIVENHNFDSQPTLDRLFELDAWAHQEALRWVCT